MSYYCWTPRIMDEIAGGGQEKTVTTDQWRQVRTLFDESLELQPSARPAFLASKCEENERIRDEVARMWRDLDEAGDFLENPLGVNASAIPFVDEIHQAAGRMIGPYRLVREIGRGGMSVVYLAERADDAYRKQAAVKLVWPALMTGEIERRFRQERRILAKLDHPNIARLLDGGVTGDGWQYVVMEYVEGEPITEWSDARKLSTTGRLRLFQQICAAVQYAHDNLIVHRDLKPNNILVSGDGTVKLLDFGIAKLLDPELLGIEDAPPSRTGVQAMTPEYASPEQARGDAITTASDVYSLGVVLYELLTGHRPYRIKSRMPHEAAQVIGEEEPPPPSAVISRTVELTSDDGEIRVTRSPEQISETREGKPEHLHARLRGDLDAIVLKALRKEPLHRYRSASEFSRDIGRHLSGKPVTARKGTLIYLTTRFVRRHKTGVVAAVLLFLAACGAFGYYVRQANAANALARKQLRLLYIADVRQAGQDLIDGNLGRARELVEKYWPDFNSKPDDDWRGFEWSYLWKALHTEQATLRHSTTVDGLVITPDGKKLLIGSESGKIELWDAVANRMERVFADLREPVRGFALSQDGKRLAAGGAGGLTRVWDVASGGMLFEKRGHGEAEISAVALSADGALLATGGRDAATRLWKVDTGELLRDFPFKGKWVRTVQFSPDGRMLAVGGTGDPALWLWDLKTFQPAATLRGSPRDPLHLLFSPDGKTLAAATRDGVVRLWDVAGRNLLRSYAGHQGLAWSVAFSPDGKLLASAGEDRTLRFRDRETGREVAVVNCEFEIGTVLFSPDNSSTTVFCTSGDSTKSYDLKELEAPSVIPHPASGDINSVAISPNGAFVAAVDALGTLMLLDAATGKPFLVASNPGYQLQSVNFSPDGKWIAIAGSLNGREAIAELRDVATGQIAASLKGHARHVTCAAFSPDGKTLATGSEDRLIKLWDADTGQERLTIQGHTDSVRTIAFSPDGSRLVSQGLGNLARVWDVKTGAQLLELESQSAARFSPDGNLIATGSANHYVKLRDASTGRELRSLRGHSGSPRALAFSPDGKRLASASEDQTIRLWDIETGLELLALKGHTGRVSSLAFSRDGRLLVSGGKDGSVRLWRTAREEAVQTKSAR